MTDGGNLGVGASSVSGTTLSLTTAITIPAGHTGVVILSADNITTTDGVSSDHTSLTDSSGAVSWTKLHEYTNGEGAAGSGITESIWIRPIQGSDLASGSTLTANFASAITHKTGTSRYFTCSVLPTLAAAAVGTLVDAANDFGSATISGLPSKQYLFIRGCAKEANVASTSDLTPSSGYSTFTAQRSQNNAAAVLVRGEFIITTGTGSTSNPGFAFSGDAASSFIVLEEVTPPAGTEPIGGVARGVARGIGRGNW
jgi:hypothetical protein